MRRRRSLGEYSTLLSQGDGQELSPFCARIESRFSFEKKRFPLSSPPGNLKIEFCKTTKTEFSRKPMVFQIRAALLAGESGSKFISKLAEERKIKKHVYSTRKSYDLFERRRNDRLPRTSAHFAGHAPAAQRVRPSPSRFSLSSCLFMSSTPDQRFVRHFDDRAVLSSAPSTFSASGC